MVRLKAGAAPVGEIGLTAFQFHYGTIKRYSTHIPRAYPFLYFNSTMVRLKENRAEFFHLFYFYFNSTMVRLKASSETRISGLELFQFHYGTIKRIRFISRASCEY